MTTFLVVKRALLILRSKCVIGRDMLSPWDNLHIGSLAREWVLLGGKGQVETTRIASTKENSKSKAYHTPRGIAEINATTKDLKDATVVIPTPFSFNLPIWVMQNTARCWRMTADYCKLTQEVTPWPKFPWSLLLSGCPLSPFLLYPVPMASLVFLWEEQLRQEEKTIKPIYWP